MEFPYLALSRHSVYCLVVGVLATTHAFLVFTSFVFFVCCVLLVIMFVSVQTNTRAHTQMGLGKGTYIKSEEITGSQGANRVVLLGTKGGKRQTCVGNETDIFKCPGMVLNPVCVSFLALFFWVSF